MWTLLFWTVGYGVDTSAVKALIQRWDKVNASRYLLVLDVSNSTPQYFRYSASGGALSLRSNSLVGLARGFKTYLQEYCNLTVSRLSTSLRVPAVLPDAPLTQVNSTARWRYFLNFCTQSYTYAFYEWADWEKKIDLMAMRGVNLVLASQGMQLLYANFMRRLNVSEEDIASSQVGPGFQAWWLMSNLYGYGLPISADWINKAAQIQRKIIGRLLALGITPALPGFYGSVPSLLKKYYPSADIQETGTWTAFRRPAILNPASPEFMTFAKLYYQQLERLYGQQIYVFAADPFHEGGSANINFTQAGINIYAGMNSRKGQQVLWLLQGWGNNPRKELVSGLAPGFVLILDLFAESDPKWNKSGFWGHLFLWNTIPNYGGRVAIFGALRNYASQYRAMQSVSPDNRGVGSAPEGSATNQIDYEYILGLGWSDSSADVMMFAQKFVRSRYGGEQPDALAAWIGLVQEILSCDNYYLGPKESLFCARPAKVINSVSSWGSAKLYYNRGLVVQSWKNLWAARPALGANQLYVNDLIDLARQCLADYGQYLQSKFEQAFDKNDSALFQQLSKQFEEAILDQDALLGTLPQFMLGQEWTRARKFATNQAESWTFTRNLKLQVTTWSETDSELHEYAHKEWSGMLRDFYLPRWRMYFQYKRKLLRGETANPPNFFEFEKGWVDNRQQYGPTPSGDPIAEHLRIYDKYYQKLKSLYLLQIQQ